MGDQVDLHKARTSLIPVAKGTDGDLVFEQRARFGGGARAQPVALPHWGQQPIDGGGTDLEQLLPHP